MLLDNLPHECTIKRRRQAKGTTGGARVTYTVVSTGVSCWEQSMSSSETTDYKKGGTRDLRKIYFTEDPGVNTRNVIVITKRLGVAVPSADQLELEVVGKPKPDSCAGFGILYSVTCGVTTQEGS